MYISKLKQKYFWHCISVDGGGDQDDDDEDNDFLLCNDLQLKDNKSCFQSELLLEVLIIRNFI